MRLVTKIQLFAQVKQALSQKLYSEKSAFAVPNSDRQKLASWELLLVWFKQPGHTKIRPVSMAWMILVGFIFGVVTMTGLLSYSGQEPINLIYFLLLYGPLQWLLMLAALLSLILRGKGLAITRWLSGQKLLQIFPGFFYRWLVFWLNQWLSISFIFASMVVFVLLLVTQDLAFGWSTTIDFAPEKITAVFQWLSTPWASWWPQAAVTNELISGTQFFRLSSGQTRYDAALFGQWWTFILAFLLFYNLLPRMILVLLGHLMMSMKVNALLRSDAEIYQLLSELRPQQVDTGSERNTHFQLASQPKTKLLQSNTEPDSPLFLWGLTMADLNHLNLDIYIESVQPLSEQTDISAVTEACVVVPGWEPPIAELADLLKRFADRSVQLLLLPLDNRLSDADIASWQMFSDSLGQVKSLSLWSQQERDA